jgi:hypothetical protein
MKRIPLTELERRCQKPDYRRVGNGMARRLSRPAALRVTQVVAPWGLSADVATLAAWAAGVAAAAAFGWGTVLGWVLGAILLQLWYLLDHVDGQLARLRGTASLDGVQLDYLMHHTINLLVPLGVGCGLFVATAEPLWPAGGLLWGISSLLITLHHDARYKAFVQRLKRLRGQLYVRGGGGGRPAAPSPPPRRPLRLLAWVARKACEMHVVLNLLALIALGQLLAADGQLLAGRVYLALMAPTAAAVAGWTIFRSNLDATAEREFAAWYALPPGCELTFSDGWWIVESPEADHTVSGAGNDGTL